MSVLNNIHVEELIEYYLSMLNDVKYHEIYTQCCEDKYYLSMLNDVKYHEIYTRCCEDKYYLSMLNDVKY